MKETEWEVLLLEANQEMMALKDRAKSIKKIKRSKRLKKWLKQHKN